MQAKRPSSRASLSGKKFLGVRFVNCFTYGRLYENNARDAYVGSCPKCGKPYYVRIGSSGTNQRMFAAYC